MKYVGPYLWRCTCTDPIPGWWNVECALCYRPIIGELQRILSIRNQPTKGKRT